MGDVVIVCNADNVVADFEREADARRFLEAMRERLAALAFLFHSLIPLKRALILGESMRRGESHSPEFWGGGELRLLARKTGVNGFGPLCAIGAGDAGRRD